MGFAKRSNSEYISNIENKNENNKKDYFKNYTQNNSFRNPIPQSMIDHGKSNFRKLTRKSFRNTITDKVRRTQNKTLLNIKTGNSKTRRYSQNGFIEKLLLEKKIIEHEKLILQNKLRNMESLINKTIQKL